MAYMESDDPVEMFRDAVVTLTTKGNVEEYMRPITAKLKNGITDMAVLNEMIDILFDHVCFFLVFDVFIVLVLKCKPLVTGCH
jgi:hypothetical protein